jgi:hypothetical protein
MHRVGGHGFGLHVEVPQLQRHVVPRQDVPPVARELYVRHAADDLTEERPRTLRIGVQRVSALPGAEQSHLQEGSSTAHAGWHAEVPKSKPVPQRHDGRDFIAKSSLTWGSVASKALACVSHNAAARMSASRMQPLLLLKANTLQCDGWKSAAVITCRGI